MMVIGMTTVFFILFFVVAGGNILIRYVNRFYPIDQDTILPDKRGNDNSKIAAIVAAVDVVSSGKGKISSIRKSVN